MHWSKLPFAPSPCPILSRFHGREDKLLSQIHEIFGLHTNSNSVTKTPQGALKQAENIVIDKDGIAEPIPGLDRIYTTIPGSNGPIKAISKYKNQLLAYDGEHLIQINKDADSHIISSFKASNPSFTDNDSLYINSDEGLLCFDSLGSRRKTGIEQAYIVSHSLKHESGEGLLKPGHVRAYRVVLGKKLSSTKVVVGAPSPMHTIYNGSDKEQRVSLTFRSVDISDAYYEIYRTADVDVKAAELEKPEQFIPDDEMYLVARVYFISPDKLITYTDRTSKDLTGNALYTSESQEGIVNANTPPPLAKEVIEHKNRLFLADIKQYAYIPFEIDGFSEGDYFLFAKNKFVCGDGFPKQSSNFDTAIALCNAINQHAENYRAEVMSHRQSPRIEMVIISYSTELFTLFIGKGTTQKRAIQSEDGSLTNGLIFSKFLEYEAFPLKNMLRVGKSSSRITKLVSLKDRLLIFLSTGLYALFGDDESTFQLDCIDPNINLLNPDSLAVLNGAVFCHTDQGIQIVTESDLIPISKPIDNLIDKSRFGVSCQKTNRYYLFDDKQAIIYNGNTGKWSTWAIKASTAYIEKGQIFVGGGDSRIILSSRNDKDYLTYHSYIDLSFDLTFITNPLYTAIDDLKLAEVGDFIYCEKAKSEFEVVKLTDEGSYNIIYFHSKLPRGDKYHLNKRIKSTVECNYFTGNLPTFIKHHQDLDLVFNEGIANAYGSVGFKTDLDPTFTEVKFDVASTRPRWGRFPFGRVPYNDKSLNQESLKKIPVPRAKRKGHRLAVKLELKSPKFQLAGFSISYRVISQKGVKNDTSN